MGGVGNSIVKTWKDKFESVIDDAHANIEGLEIEVGMGMPENWKESKFGKVFRLQVLDLMTSRISRSQSSKSPKISEPENLRTM